MSTGSGAALSILVLSEDSSPRAHEVMSRLATHAFRLVDAAVWAHRIRFEPASDDARRAMRANMWRSTNSRDHQRQVALRRSIATKLCEHNGFVIFHFDGDAIWTKRDTCLTKAQFQRLIVDQVRLLVAANISPPRNAAQRRRRPLPKRSPADVPEEANADGAAAALDKVMHRLFCFVPFYSIESWLYQHTRKARELCGKHHASRCAATFDSWEADRGVLDEVDKPKDCCCLGAEHNLDLASDGYPACETYDAGKSFFAAVEELRRSDALAAALAATRGPAPAPTLPP